ncbi:Wzz/FepE/Etk N-terminal domain-containing protein [Rhizobium puerariae]|uniref:Wzz/FepE/Etk N-terminal domain-containing protein n=1 Tax=Rhizobium puerariae TaxID=1585791 RepID=A0ABV6ACF8_9HYPH
MTFNSPGPLERASRLWRLEGVPADNAGDGPIALLRLVSALAWQHKARLIACTATGLILAALYAQSLPRIYDATATLLLEPRQGIFSGHDVGAQPSLDLNSAESELQIIRSERLLSAVFESLSLYDDPELGPQPPGAIRLFLSRTQDLLRTLMDSGLKSIDKTSRSPLEVADNTIAGMNDSARRTAFSNFVRRIDARRVGQSYVVEIGYASSNPERPARVANAIVSGYILQSVAFKEQMARAGTETLQGRLDALAAQVNAAQEAMKSGTLPTIPTPDADARIIGAALPPLSPSSPRSSLITALGGLLGLLCGMSTIALGVAFDRKVRNARDLSQDTGIPCLARVPDAGEKTGLAWRMDSQSLSRYAAAIRDLRTSIDIACASQRRERNIVIALVGATQGIGVSTLCLSLAQLLSRSGRHVTFFQSETEIQNDYGNRPSASLADAAISGAYADHLPFEDFDGIAILPIHSKDLHTNIFADFRHPRVLRILEAARMKGDVVLDLPALNTSMDALALTFHADAVLLVARAGRTTTEEVKDAHQQLRRAGANVIGTVINRARL